MPVWSQPGYYNWIMDSITLIVIIWIIIIVYVFGSLSYLLVWQIGQLVGGKLEF